MAVVAGVGFASTGFAKPAAVPRLVFPVVGPVTYKDDFGEPRAKWPHPGNDLVAPKRAVAVAAEAGKVVFWTRSASAGCMLYLYGASGTTYQYIHLNNDLGHGNDNRGKCVAGTAYAPGLKDGAEVAAGQPVGFVGDSGDANGIHAHLHFEVHPGGGKPVDPYPYLRRAERLLFPADPGTSVSMTAEGTVSSASGDELTLKISKLVLLPSLVRVRQVRALPLSVPPEAQIDTGGALAAGSVAETLPTLVGQRVVILTSPTPATLAVALGRPGAIAAARIAVNP